MVRRNAVFAVRRDAQATVMIVAAFTDGGAVPIEWMRRGICRRAREDGRDETMAVRRRGLAVKVA